ncbi:hypothetical protein [Dyadobacter pollutisoli]|uniref:Alpha-L-arabinofuranosidase n=1 Tax=Dyadobacter pollutisoli TaxID=2910158 RepID=A0A9E8NHL5_9BACT|nr:hypothetical protein [Dyadobacter pollutisoli]WAC15157.1 hypothetical protein ON006_14550 [Dyadobacter pollutisoli]
MKTCLRNSFLSLLMFSCSKDDQLPKQPDPIVNVVPVDDPAIESTVGFFLDNWRPKTFTAPAYTDENVPDAAGATVTLDASSVITRIPGAIFGQNANTWMGVPTTRAQTDIRNLDPHILRFPGGNLSNNYFWNAGQDEPPADLPEFYVDKDGKKQKASWVYGRTDHNWEVTLDSYYALLQQTNSLGMISVNYGYARYSTAANPVANAAHLAADWVRYDNGRTKYWEIGNEHYGDWQGGYRIDLSTNKDGQPEIITGELYGKHVQVFVDSMKKAARDIGKTIFVGAVAYENLAEAWDSQTTKTWNAGMFKAISNKADFYVVHNYFTPYDQNSDASVVFNSALTQGEKMMNFIKQQIQTYGAAPKPIALTEWNMWAKDSKQQVSNVSGLFAVIVQAEALKNKYGMAARWDLLNGWDNGNDHGLFSNGDEGGGIPKWTPRPSFYYMYYFQKLLGDRLVPTMVSGTSASAIKAYGSTYSSGQSNVTLINTSGAVQVVEVKFKNFNAGKRFYWYTLEGENDNGEFSRKVRINGSGSNAVAGGPSDYETIKSRSASTSKGIKVTVPARGGVFVVIDKP